MTTITLDWLKSKKPCADYFRKHFTEIFSIELIDHLLKTDDMEKINYANWLISNLLDHKQCVRYAVYAAESVLPLFESEYRDDNRARLAIKAAKSWIDDPSEENILAAEKAENAARAVGWAAYEEDCAADEAACAALYAAMAVKEVAAAEWAAKAAAKAANYTNYTYDYKKTLIDIVNYGVWLL